MTRDEIVLLAKEADLWLTSDERIAAVVRFAELVADAERSACAQVCEFMRPSKAEFDQRYYAGCTDSAAAIRARREQ